MPRQRRYKKDFTETVTTADMEKKADIEKGYSMEYEKGKPGQLGRWLHVIKDPKTGEALEKRVAIRGNFHTIWRRSDDE